MKRSMLKSWLVVAAIAAFAAPAFADEATDEPLCLSNPTPDLAACSRLIDGGGLQGEKLAAAYVARARALANARRFDDATADYDKAIALAPGRPEYLNLRGVAFALGKGDRARGIDDYSQAIALDPKYEPAYRNRGLARLQNREFDAALDDLSRAVELAPSDFLVLHYRGMVYAAKGSSTRRSPIIRSCSPAIPAFSRPTSVAPRPIDGKERSTRPWPTTTK